MNMMLRLPVLLLSVFCACRPSALLEAVHTEPETSVLFIGNSLTYVNDLPATLTSVAASSGKNIRTQMVALPNFALIDHLAEGSAVAAMERGRWDYVVLQQGPSSVDVNRDSLILWTKMFDEHIKRAHARPALYMVWPDDSRLAFFNDVRLSYQQAAQAVGGLFMPAGVAWQEAWLLNSGLKLYGPDGYHPSELGTYLAALVMYERITGEDSRSLTGSAVVAGHAINVSTETIRQLREAAHTANAKYPAFP